MTDKRLVLQYKPQTGPRRRVTFERDRDLDETDAWAYWRIEEVYSTVEEQWREIGREHCTEPDLLIESEGVPEDVARTADTGVSPDA